MTNDLVQGYSKIILCDETKIEIKFENTFLASIEKTFELLSAKHFQRGKHRKPLLMILSSARPLSYVTKFVCKLENGA